MTHGTRLHAAHAGTAAAGGGAAAVPMLWSMLSSLLLSSPATAETPLTSSGEMTCERAALGDCNFVDTASGLEFRWPNDWPVRRLKLVTESGPRANARLRGATRWVALQYTPDDPAQPEVVMFSLAVLERDVWIDQSNRSRAPTGVEVATSATHVAIVSLADGHPYAPESRDADIFEALLPTVEQVSRTVRFPTAVERRASNTVLARRLATSAHGTYDVRSSIRR